MIAADVDTEVRVRAFHPDDAAFAAALAARVFARPWTAAQYAQEAAAADRDYLVAEWEGRAVGFAGAWDAPDVTHVMTVAVAEHARRRGIGRRLVTTLLDRARDRGAGACTLEVRADAPAARRLYAQLGFVEVGRRPGYYPPMGVERGSEREVERGSERKVERWVDAVLMTRAPGLEDTTCW